MRRLLLLLVTALGGLALAGVAQAATSTLGGTAVVEDGHVKLVSNFADNPATTTNDAGWVSFTGTGVTTFNSITNLGAHFNATDDGCKGGSPRFTIDFAGTTNNVHVYLGTYNAGSGTFDCALNTWLSSGNLVTSTDPRFDLTQFGGPFYGTYAQAQALVGGLTVDEIRFAVDGGWAFDPGDEEQTVLLRNVVINGSLFFGPQAPTGMNPAQTCRALRTAMDAVLAGSFAQMFGDNTTRRNAFGKCVAHYAKLRVAATSSATKACRSEGKRGQELRACVAARAGTTFAVKANAHRRAGLTCATERKASGRAAFKTKYGFGPRKVNAMRRCVAQHLA